MGTGTLELIQGVAWKERFARATGSLRFDGRGVDVFDILMNKGDGEIRGAASLRWQDASYVFNATGTRIPVQLLDNFQFPKAPLTGLLNFEASGSSTFDNPSYDFTGRIGDLFVGDEGIGFVDGTLHVRNKVLVIERINVASARLQVFGSGSIALNDAADARFDLTFTNSLIDPYLKFFAPEMSPYTRAVVSGRLTADGPIAADHIEDLRVEMTIDTASLTLFDYELNNEGPITLRFDDHAFKIPVGALVLAGKDTKLAMSGSVDSRAQRVDLTATGQASLAVLQLFFPNLGASGGAKLNATYTGPFGAAKLTGRADIENGRLRLAGLTQTLNEINGPIAFDAAGINVAGLRARFGESDVVFGGNITLDGMRLREYNLTARGQQMAVRYPPGLRSVVDANLYFRGPVNAPTLGGEVIVTRADYRPQLPSNTGLMGLAAGGLGGGGGAEGGGPQGESTVPVALAIEIRAPRMRFIDNETATIFGRANLQVVGTLDRPFLTGRVDIENGEVRLGATRLLVQPGTIDFVNNQPVFDVEAITRPRVAGQTYDIDVRLRGTLDKLTPTFSSDPWLPNLQIVAMVLGSVPSDRTLRSAELQASQSQQNLQIRVRSRRPAS